MPLPSLPEPFDPTCRRCPRLVNHLDHIREQHPAYHCAPVAAWGSLRARLLVVGLAPGLHGANRTGRPFSGDASGVTLFESLAAAGFAMFTPRGVVLRNCRITNAVRCLPPGNRPLTSEVENCGPYLADDLERLRGTRPRCVVTLGALAFKATAAAFGARGTFAHGLELDVLGNVRSPLRSNVTLLAAYHPSRLNINTGRLTQSMLDAVFRRAAEIV
ncbi:MAG: uracil-DNA glycosylase [Gammaproteobacteria bacterium]|nr:uracil-DNA glycosylase [Gammaproteobacteria bacterium]